MSSVAAAESTLYGQSGKCSDEKGEMQLLFYSFSSSDEDFAIATSKSLETFCSLQVWADTGKTVQGPHLVNKTRIGRALEVTLVSDLFRLPQFYLLVSPSLTLERLGEVGVSLQKHK